MPVTKLPLLIDDLPIRKSLFKEASQVLKKIEKLEAERDRFHEKDQALYQNWFDLTFQAEREKATALHQEFVDLAMFHNSVLAQQELYDQTFSEAVAALKREEKQYEKGTEEQRRKIELKRQKRDEFLKESMKDKEEPPPTERQKERQQQKESFFFVEALIVAFQQREGLKILKMWDQATDEMKADAEESFLELRGASITQVIEKLKLEKARLEEIANEARKSPSTPQDPKQELKSLYRKLARRLHPDVAKPLEGKITKAWIQQIWLKVQAAHNARDLETLRRLELTTLIRMEDIRSLSFDEIRASREALEEEFQELRLSIRDDKKHPAWKFSTKRTYETLKKKIKDQFRRDLDALRHDVEGLQSIYGSRWRG